jgi:hypothetical protein
VLARGRHALLALAAALTALTLLALPVLHPGAWAHSGLELGSRIAALESGAGAPVAGDDHLRCPLCRVLAQARGALASPALSAPCAPLLAASAAPPHRAALPAAPALAGPEARAPPRSA